MITRQWNHALRKIILLFAFMAIIAGCAGLDGQSTPAAVPEIHPGILAGYLDPKVLPTSLAILPPPPAEGSAAHALDEEVSRTNLALRDTPRWDLAARDAELMFPKAAGTFSCALGIPITERDTPHLYMLLRRTLADAGLSTYTAKDYYRRKRPFMLNKAPICTPEEEGQLRKDGSYPSGHTAIGWAWALILTEIAPERADAILARGRTFGESRVVCNVHWHSDVVEGRFIGAAAVARLHADTLFLAELKAAKAEYKAAPAGDLKPTRNCQDEIEALAQHWQFFNGEAKILQSWEGDYPTARLDLLPENQRENSVGFINNAEIFKAVWNAFKPEKAAPQIDFNTNVVLFGKNTQFYTRIRIGKVNVKNGVAEVLAMETMSAMPIEDRVAMSMVVVSRKGITGVQSGDGIMQIYKTT